MSGRLGTGEARVPAVPRLASVAERVASIVKEQLRFKERGCREIEKKHLIPGLAPMCTPSCTHVQRHTHMPHDKQTDDGWMDR